MKTLALLALMVVLGLGAPAAAEGLDDVLRLPCPVGEDDLPARIEGILRQYGPEIVERSRGFEAFDGSYQHETLVWYLGMLESPDARAIGRRILREAPERLAYRFLAGVAQKPSWEAVALLLEGIERPEDVLRSSASTMLADLDMRAFRPAQGTDAAVRAAAIARVSAAMAKETDPATAATLQ